MVRYSACDAPRDPIAIAEGRKDLEHLDSPRTRNRLQLQSTPEMNSEATSHTRPKNTMNSQTKFGTRWRNATLPLGRAVDAALPGRGESEGQDISSTVHWPISY